MRQDTTPAQFERYMNLLRGASEAERLRSAVALSMGVRRLAEAGIRLRHPNASEEEVQVRLAVRLYGRSAVAGVFRAIPEDAV